MQIYFQWFKAQFCGTKRSYQQLQARLKTDPLPWCDFMREADQLTVDDFLRDVANIIRWASINREAFDDRWLLTLSKTKAIDEVKLCPRQHLNYHTKALFMTVCDFEKLSNISFGGCDRKSRQNTSNWVSTRPNAPNTSKGVSKHVQSCMSWGHCV